MKLQYLLIDTQKIELSSINIQKIYKKIEKILSLPKNYNKSLVLSILLGKPILDDNPIRYIQTNTDLQKLPVTSDYFSNTKNNIHSFY